MGKPQQASPIPGHSLGWVGAEVEPCSRGHRVFAAVEAKQGGHVCPALPGALCRLDLACSTFCGVSGQKGTKQETTTREGARPFLHW